MNTRQPQILAPPPLKVRFRPTPADQQYFQFSKAFRIGRVEECEICINNDYVSRVHAEVVFENGAWWVHDLNSSNGIYVGGERVKHVPVRQATVIRLGVYGTEVSLEVEAAPAVNKAPTGSETMVARYVEHYFGKPAGGNTDRDHTTHV